MTFRIIVLETSTIYGLTLFPLDAALITKRNGPFAQEVTTGCYEDSQEKRNDVYPVCDDDRHDANVILSVFKNSH